MAEKECVGRFRKLTLHYDFSMRVRLGLTLLSKVDEFVVTKQIRRVIEHPKHRGLEAYFDVAIVVIDPVQLSTRIGIGSSHLAQRQLAH